MKVNYSHFKKGKTEYRKLSVELKSNKKDFFILKIFPYILWVIIVVLLMVTASVNSKLNEELKDSIDRASNVVHQ